LSLNPFVSSVARLFPSVRKFLQGYHETREQLAKVGRRNEQLESELLRFATDHEKKVSVPSQDVIASPPVNDMPDVATWLPEPTQRAADGRRRMTVYVDIFGGCNLRCPSCPVSSKLIEGSDSIERGPKGLMSEETLGRILDKAMAECEVSSVGLFNWTEPLLNPKVAELVSAVKSRGLFCSISSNLNVARNLEAILEAGLDWMRISVSGYTNENYTVTHSGGDINVVKQNMRDLSEIVRRTGAKTDIEVFYHKYLGNFDDEVKMRAFSEGLGFRFVSAWAQMMPVEKVISYVNPESPIMPLSESDHMIIDRLALPLQDAIEETSRHPVSFCALQDDYLAIDVTGNVSLCCAVSNGEKNQIGSFLDTPLETIQQKKAEHSLCGKCMKLGLPLYLEHRPPAFSKFGTRRLARYYAENGMKLTSS